MQRIHLPVSQNSGEVAITQVISLLQPLERFVRLAPPCVRLGDIVGVVDRSAIVPLAHAVHWLNDLQNTRHERAYAPDRLRELPKISEQGRVIEFPGPVRGIERSSLLVVCLCPGPVVLPPFAYYHAG